MVQTPWHVHIAMMTVALVFGVGANGIVIAVRIFSKIKRDRHVYKFLILQLAIADLIFASTIFFDLYDHINKNQWSFGKWGCKIIRSTQSISITSEVGFLVIMTAERCFGTVRPFARFNWSARKLNILVAVNWLWVSVTLVPFFVALDVSDGGHCGEIKHPSISFRKAYTLFLFITDYACPLLLIFGFNLKIVHSILQHQDHFTTANRDKIGEKDQELSNQMMIDTAPAQNRSKVSQSQINERKLFKILVVITLCFAIFMLPNQIYYIWLDFGTPSEWSQTHGWLLIMFGGLVYLHCVANAVIYSLMDAQFRKQAMSLVKRILCCLKSNDSKEPFNNAKRDVQYKLSGKIKLDNTLTNL